LRAYVWAVFLLGVSIAAAQSSNSADLEGTITDSTGAAMAGAKLTVTNTGTHVTRTAVTNSFGLYRLPALQAGEYDLQFSKDGFAVVDRHGLTLRVGQLATVDVELPVASQTQRVVVEGEASIVEPGKISAGAVVDRPPYHGRGRGRGRR